MDQSSLRAQLQEIMRLHRAGQSDAARQRLRALAASRDEDPDLLHAAAVIELESNRAHEAEPLLRRALAQRAGDAGIHFTRATCLRALGRPDEAIAAWRRSAELNPRLIEAHANIAATLTNLARWGEAETEWRRVLSAAPNWAPGFAQLAHVLSSSGRDDDATAALRRAIELDPNQPDTCAALGGALLRQRRPREAVEPLRRAANMQTRDANVWLNLGSALLAFEKDLTEAVECFRRAVAITPDSVSAHSLLVMALREAGCLREAAEAVRAAMEVAPVSSVLYEAQALVEEGLGEIDQAVTHYREALQADPLRAHTHSNLLMILPYHLPDDPRAIFEEHLRWGQAHADPLTAAAAPIEPDRNPSRRLRIGYVSGDLRNHPVARFFQLLLAGHDPQRVEGEIFSDVRTPDEVTARLHGSAHQWHDTSHLTDEQLAELIRSRAIDILVDLAGHTSHHRLLAFARRPAPVQVTYLGYWNTTGMAAMDWRLTDAWCDPPGLTEHLWRERLLRLDGGAWCFRPMDDLLDVNELPAARNGFVTFISPHRAIKLTEPLLRMWAELLRHDPASRLILVTGGETRRIADALGGVDPSRLRFIDRVDGREYLRLYHEADVLLDVWPHGGHATACDALWMGVPVVTRAGDTHMSRLCTSVLHEVGLPQFSCAGADEYVALAGSMRDRVDELRDLRRSMRERLRASALSDGQRLARAVEAAFVQMWRS